MNKELIALSVIFFFLFVIALELHTGIAVRGWLGNFGPVERNNNPGPYWIAIAMHVLLWIGLLLLIWFQA